MTALTIKKKLHDYIDAASHKKLDAIYTLLESDIESGQVDWDDALIKKLNRRRREMKNGTVKTLTWNEMEKAARKIIRDKRKR